MDKKIWMYCTLGERLDHTIANIRTSCWAAQRIGFVKIFNGHDEIYFLSKSKLVISKKEGYSLSIFAISDICNGVIVKNAKYHLKMQL